MEINRLLDSSTPVIIIPAYNEEKRIEKTFHLILETFNNPKIVIVMDGCTDRTKEIVYGLADDRVTPLVYEQRLGKGGAIMEGLKQAEGNVIALLDADGATTPKELLKLIEEIDQYDLVIGSRYHEDSKILIGEPLIRVFLSRVFNTLIRMMFRKMRNIRDTQCGAKVFNGTLLDKISKDLFITDFAFDVNLIYSALRHGLKVKEKGITWKHIEDASKVSARPFRQALKMFLSLLRLRIYYSRLNEVLKSEPISKFYKIYKRL